MPHGSTSRRPHSFRAAFENNLGIMLGRGDRTTQFAKSRNTSTGNDGGQITMKRSAGTVERNSFGKRKKRKLSDHEMARAAYHMAKDNLPRTKSVSFKMYNHGAANDAFQETLLYSGIDSQNSATSLSDRSLTAESFYGDQVDVIPSGHSLCFLEDQSMSRMIASAIFPLSHINLIIKGDDQDERLGDFVELTGMHVTGRISCKIFHPGLGASGATPYVALGDSLETIKCVPHGPVLDQQRKVRMMFVEVMDTTVATGSESAQNTNPLVYRNSGWFSDGQLASGTRQMTVVGAPRLEQLLEVPSIATLGAAVAGAGDREHVENGRWLKIDRKYRSNHRNDNLWLDPSTGRAVDFRILKDISFTLKPDVINKRMADALKDDGHNVGKNSYVDVDFFIKLNADLSYDTFAAGVDNSAVVSNASRHFFMYLFDDHVDKLAAAGNGNPSVAVGTTQRLINDVVQYGYAMCQARLNCDVFFNDDL